MTDETGPNPGPLLHLAWRNTDKPVCGADSVYTTQQLDQLTCWACYMTARDHWMT